MLTFDRLYYVTRDYRVVLPIKTNSIEEIKQEKPEEHPLRKINLIIRYVAQGDDQQAGSQTEQNRLHQDDRRGERAESRANREMIASIGSLKESNIEFDQHSRQHESFKKNIYNIFLRQKAIRKLTFRKNE